MEFSIGDTAFPPPCILGMCRSVCQITGNVRFEPVVKEERSDLLTERASYLGDLYVANILRVCEYPVS